LAVVNETDSRLTTIAFANVHCGPNDGAFESRCFDGDIHPAFHEREVQVWRKVGHNNIGAE